MRWVVVALLVALVGAGCSGGGARSAPTPDPFGSVSAQAESAYQDGARLLQEGRYREANDALERARLLSPTTDQRIEDLLAQTHAVLTPTVVPTTPTAVPSPTALTRSQATPDAALARAYFGNVYLTVVPGEDKVQPPMTTFYREDQIGLYIESLTDRLRAPFTLRVFNAVTGAVVASVQGGGGDSGTPTPVAAELSQFFSHYVWYHRGGETPGTYVLELYSGDTLVQTLSYTVVATPVAIPSPTVAPTVVPTIVEPTATPAPTFTPEPAPTPAPVPVPLPAPVAPPAPVVIVAPTPVPAPRAAASVYVEGVPLAVDSAHVVDGGGLVWPLSGAQPSLSRPLSVNGRATGVASDDTSVYVALANPPQLAVVSASSGQVLGLVDLPGQPGVVRLDAGLGRAFVSVPDQQSMALVDLGARAVVSTTSGLGQVTGVAVDPDSHLVYVAAFGGTVSVVDGRNGEKTDVVQLTGDGLTDATVASGRVYAVNTPAVDLSILDLATGQVSHRSLEEEPTAVAADARGGVVYVVEGGSVVRFDLQGAQRGRALLPGVGAPPVDGVPGDQVAIAADGSVYVIRPSERTLWLARADAFGP